MNILKMLVAFLFALFLLPAGGSARALPVPTNFSDYEPLKVYGVQQGVMTTMDDAHRLLDSALGARLSPEAETELHRFLVYDALRQYLGFLLYINPQPGEEYFKRFKSLWPRLDGGFPAIQRDAIQTAVKLSHKLRFDVSMIQLATKEIYNLKQEAGVAAQMEVILSRLNKISGKLSQLYPASHGELPPVLLAYVSSVFMPRTEAERMACAEKFSEEVKSDVMRILATEELGKLGELLNNPVVYNITPMGSVSSRVNSN
jgi:hypothetical protein